VAGGDEEGRYGADAPDDLRRTDLAMNQIQRHKKLVSVPFTTGTDIPLITIIEAVAADITGLAEAAPHYCRPEARLTGECGCLVDVQARDRCSEPETEWELMTACAVS
jgi:hypothetical protein